MNAPNVDVLAHRIATVGTETPAFRLEFFAAVMVV